MLEYLKKNSKNFDLSLYKKETIKKYHDIINNQEELSELLDDLPKNISIKNISLEYFETQFFMKEEFVRFLIVYKLFFDGEDLGSYKCEFSMDGEIIDDYLIIN